VKTSQWIIATIFFSITTSTLAGGPDPIPVDHSAFYLGIQGGASLTGVSPNYEELFINAYNIPNAFPLSNQLNNFIHYSVLGLNVGGQFGYRFDNNVRIEAQADWFAHDIRTMNIPNPYNLKRNMNFLALMGNIYYDFISDGKVIPYIGAGAGVILSWLRMVVPKLPVTPGTIYLVRNGHMKFAYQAIFGLDYRVNTKWQVGVNYHILCNSDLGDSFENQFNLSVNYFFKP